MKYLKLVILSFVFSLPAIAVVSKGDTITAKKFNESMLVIGTIQTSLLTQSQFQSLQGNCWVKMEGQDILGTDLANLTGMSQLPDASGKFLRTTGGSAPALGVVQLDAFQGHHHSFNAGSSYGGYTPGRLSMEAPTFRGVFSSGILGPISDGVNGTPRIANETRPVNIGVNTFIKINHDCN